MSHETRQGRAERAKAVRAIEEKAVEEYRWGRIAGSEWAAEIDDLTPIENLRKKVVDPGAWQILLRDGAMRGVYEAMFPDWAKRTADSEPWKDMDDFWFCFTSVEPVDSWLRGFCDGALEAAD